MVAWSLQQQFLDTKRKLADYGVTDDSKLRGRHAKCSVWDGTHGSENSGLAACGVRIELHDRRSKPSQASRLLGRLLKTSQACKNISICVTFGREIQG